MRKAVWDLLEKYISVEQNMVAQYISNMIIIYLLLEAEMWPVVQVERRWL